MADHDKPDGSAPRGGEGQEGGESLGTVLLALFANAVIAVAKAVAGTLTGSGALLSEAAHSVADCEIGRASCRERV